MPPMRSSVENEKPWRWLPSRDQGDQHPGLGLLGQGADLVADGHRRRRGRPSRPARRHSARCSPWSSTRSPCILSSRRARPGRRRAPDKGPDVVPLVHSLTPPGANRAVGIGNGPVGPRLRPRRPRGPAAPAARPPARSGCSTRNWSGSRRTWRSPSMEEDLGLAREVGEQLLELVHHGVVQTGRRQVQAQRRRHVGHRLEELDLHGDELGGVVPLSTRPFTRRRRRRPACGRSSVIVLGNTMTSTAPWRSSRAKTAMRSPFLVHLRWRPVTTPPTVRIAPSSTSASSARVHVGLARAAPPRRPCSGWSLT